MGKRLATTGRRHAGSVGSVPPGALGDASDGLMDGATNSWDNPSPRPSRSGTIRLKRTQPDLSASNFLAVVERLHRENVELADRLGFYQSERSSTCKARMLTSRSRLPSSAAVLAVLAASWDGQGLVTTGLWGQAVARRQDYALAPTGRPLVATGQKLPTQTRPGEAVGDAELFV